jgi:hypothetical protein
MDLFLRRFLLETVPPALAAHLIKLLLILFKVSLTLSVPSLPGSLSAQLILDYFLVESYLESDFIEMLLQLGDIFFQFGLVQPLLHFNLEVVPDSTSFLCRVSSSVS